MSYDLCPKNKKVKEKRVGAFSWPIIMQETGAGYVLGYGSGRSPGSYVYQNDRKGSPASNDGYRVTATEAKAMSMVLRGFVSVQRFVNKEWEEMGQEERKYAEKAPKGTYRGTWDEGRLKEIEDLADFFTNSKGFSIN